VFTARYVLSLYIQFRLIIVFKAVSRLSPRRHRFDPGSVHVALAQASEYCGFPPSVTFHQYSTLTIIHLLVALSSRTKRPKPGTLPKTSAFFFFWKQRNIG
jgi:hypothetical protein